jgi:hypothetical protein
MVRHPQRARQRRDQVTVEKVERMRLLHPRDRPEAILLLMRLELEYLEPVGRVLPVAELELEQVLEHRFREDNREPVDQEDQM